MTLGEANDLATPVRPSGRITSIDTLRGVAVLGILIINIQWVSMIEGASWNPTFMFPFEGGNWWAWVLSHVLADQKFMTIFSLLFGAGVLLMTSRVESHGGSSRGIHYRRMFILLLIGLAHAYLLWFGDILVTYAFCGMLIYPLRMLRPGKLIAIGIVTVAVASILSLLFGWSMQFWPEEDIRALMTDWRPSSQEVTDDMAAYRGSYGEIFVHRAPAAFGFHTFVFLVWGMWRAGGLMLIGMGLHKLDVFGAGRTVVFYATLILAALLIGIPTVIYGLYRNIEDGWTLEYSFFIGNQYNYWGSIVVSLGWIGAIMLLCKSVNFGFLTQPLAAVGRMALTNYLMQTVLVTTIFYGYGLGLYGQVDRVGQVLIVFGVWALLLIASPIWLRYFRFGPAEWLWRSVTYRRAQPMRRL
jgi:uncharacterized protein